MIFDFAEIRCILDVLKILSKGKSKYSTMFKDTKVSHTTLQSVLKDLIQKKFIKRVVLDHMNVDYEITEGLIMEYGGTIYQDAFIVSITEIGNPDNNVTLISETIDSLASVVSPVTNSFDQGDVYATGWNLFSLSIPASLLGKKVELKFLSLGH